MYDKESREKYFKARPRILWTKTLKNWVGDFKPQLLIFNVYHTYQKVVKQDSFMYSFIVYKRRISWKIIALTEVLAAWKKLLKIQGL